MASTAKGITIAGLVIQLIMFGLFIITSVVFEKRMDRFSSGTGLSSWRLGGQWDGIRALFLLRLGGNKARLGKNKFKSSCMICCKH